MSHAKSLHSAGRSSSPSAMLHSVTSGESVRLSSRSRRNTISVTHADGHFDIIPYPSKPRSCFASRVPLRTPTTRELCTPYNLQRVQSDMQSPPLQRWKPIEHRLPERFSAGSTGPVDWLCRPLHLELHGIAPLCGQVHRSTQLALLVQARSASMSEPEQSL